MKKSYWGFDKGVDDIYKIWEEVTCVFIISFSFVNLQHPVMSPLLIRKDLSLSLQPPFLPSFVAIQFLNFLLHRSVYVCGRPALLSFINGM